MYIITAAATSYAPQPRENDINQKGKKERKKKGKEKIFKKRRKEQEGKKREKRENQEGRNLVLWGQYFRGQSVLYI